MSSEYKAKIISYNWAALLDVDITTTSQEETNFYVTNVRNADPDMIFKTPDQTAYIDIAFNETRLVGAWAVVDHNMGIGGNINVKYYRDNQLVFEENVGAQGALYNPYDDSPYVYSPYGYPTGGELDALNPNTVNFLDEDLLCDRVLFTLSEGFGIRVGYITVGDPFETRINIDWGSHVQLLVESNLVNAPSGHSYARYNPTKRTFVMSWNFLTDREANDIIQAMRVVIRNHNPVFISMFEGWGSVLEPHHELLAFVEGMEGPIMDRNKQHYLRMIGTEVTYDNTV